MTAIASSEGMGLGGIETERFDPKRVGKFWDEVAIGDRFFEYPERLLPLTEDLVRRFAILTNDQNPLHIDGVYAARTAYRRPIVHGALLTCLAIGQYHRTNYTYGTLLGMIRMTSHFIQPAYIGNVVYIEMKVTGKAETAHPRRGTASYEVWVRKVEGHAPLVRIDFEVLILRKAAARGLYRLGLSDEILAARVHRCDTDPPPPPGILYPSVDDMRRSRVGATLEEPQPPVPLR